MQVLRIEDPRSGLERASRYELCQLAAANGITEITYECGLDLKSIIEILRSKGVHSIKVPDRPLGIYKPVLLGLEDQPRTEPVKSEPVKMDKPVKQMSMTELRSECKRRGIKMARTDNMNTLREKLRG